MISRCPSCGAPAPDEVRQCRACGWDFVANKKAGAKSESGAGKAKVVEPSVESPPPPPPPPPPASEVPQAQPSLPQAQPKPAPPPEPAAAQAPAERRSGVSLAALAVGALVLLSLGAIFFMLRSEPEDAARPMRSSPFGKRSSGDVLMTPILEKHVAPAVSRDVEPSKPEPVAPAPAAPAPLWLFEGTISDLLSTRGVPGVRLIFIDPQGKEVAAVETGADGHYRAAVKPGPPEGYVVRVVHDDYSMRAAARSLAWIGSVSAPVRRDMALVPKVAAP